MDNRLRELGIYSEYYYRKEIKSLVQVLKDEEKLNCIFTGVNDGNRKMVAVTDQRLIVFFAGALGSGEVKVIKRSAVTEYGYDKKFFFPTAYFETKDAYFDFTNVQHGRKELFDWAMSRPLPEE